MVEIIDPEYVVLVRKEMDVKYYEHERLSNSTIRHKLM